MGGRRRATTHSSVHRSSRCHNDGGLWLQIDVLRTRLGASTGAYDVFVDLLGVVLMPIIIAVSTHCCLFVYWSHSQSVIYPLMLSVIDREWAYKNFQKLRILTNFKNEFLKFVKICNVMNLTMICISFIV